MNSIDIKELRVLTEEFVAAEPDRIGTEGFWQTPLLVSAPIDERFDILPQVAFNEHMLPRDLLPSAPDRQRSVPGQPVRPGMSRWILQEHTLPASLEAPGRSQFRSLSCDEREASPQKQHVNDPGEAPGG